MAIASVAAGQRILASKINEIIDAVNARDLFRGISNTTQSIANNTWTDVLLQAETYDTDNGHSTVTNTARYVMQRAGYYRPSAAVYFNTGTTGRVGIRLALNGTVIPQSKTIIGKVAAGVATPLATDLILCTNAGSDYVTMQAFQETGGAINIGNAAAEDNSRLILEYVRPT